ncbi:hypothetical protein [Thiocapsa sp.]|uniref:hypothetical protein n=1 Tax=Thiocapsa sp. TaxID=2024551 RepID=UPI003592FBFA
MTRKLLKTGDRIRLKVPTMSGWRGLATVTEDMLHPDHPVIFLKDSGDPRRDLDRCCCARRHEVALLRDQTPRTDWVERIEAAVTTNPGTLLHRMLADGFDIEARDGTLYVSPAEQLTDGLRAEIIQHKPALLALLSEPKRIDWFADAGLRERMS